MLLTGLSADAKEPINPELGSMDDVDEIVRRASQYSIRVLVELNAGQGDLNSAARLWLVHGAAGFYAPGASPQQLADLKRTAGSFAGQRVVIGDREADGAPGHGTDAPALVADGRAGTGEKLSPSSLRTGLEASQQIADQGRSMPLLFSDGPGLKRSFTRYGDGTHDTTIAKGVAATLLTNRGAAMLYFGQELGVADGTNELAFGEAKKGETPAAGSEAAGNASGASLLNWYRQLTAVAHSNRTIASGAMTILNHDDQNVVAWIRRPASVSPSTPAIIVVENLSSQPVTLSLKEDVQRLHLKGSFLRTLLRSDQAMGAMHLDSMTLEPYMVFIGELRY